VSLPTDGSAHSENGARPTYRNRLERIALSFTVTDFEAGMFDVTVVTAEGEVWDLRPGEPGAKAQLGYLVKIPLSSNVPQCSSAAVADPESQPRPVQALALPPSPYCNDFAFAGCVTSDGRVHSWRVLYWDGNRVDFDHWLAAPLPGIRMAARCTNSSAIAIKDDGTVWFLHLKPRTFTTWEEVRYIPTAPLTLGPSPQLSRGHDHRCVLWHCCRRCRVHRACG
jgi:hypothetical protein